MAQLLLLKRMLMKKTQFDVVIDPVAECSVMIKIDLKESKRSATDSQQPHSAEVTSDISVYVASISQQIRETFGTYLMNVTPAYHTILVDYLPYRVSEPEFIRQLHQLVSNLNTRVNTHSAPVVMIPTYYSEQTALDLPRFQQQGLSLDKLVELHTRITYQVSAVGFMPGFAFLSDVSPELCMPRHQTPRLSVPKGSVGIADSKTAVYPDQSPGGWNIIGRTPIQLFDTKATLDQLNQGAFFNVGDKVKFEAISKQEFVALGGCLND